MKEAAQAGDTEAPIQAEVGVPLAEAILAFRKEDYERAVDLLMPVRYDLQRIGGSHAQRDLFAQLLVHATLRAGRYKEARALLNERTGLKPASAPNWMWYAEALVGAGDTAGAARARARADELLAA
jgi:predicted Zn-dependent protease